MKVFSYFRIIISIILSFICPYIGMIYIGQYKKAIYYFVWELVFIAIPLIYTNNMSIYITPITIRILLTLLLRVVAAIHTYIIIKKDNNLKSKKAYVNIGFVIIVSLLTIFVRTQLFDFVSIVGSSFEPEFKDKGLYLVIKKMRVDYFTDYDLYKVGDAIIFNGIIGLEVARIVANGNQKVKIENKPFEVIKNTPNDYMKIDPENQYINLLTEQVLVMPHNDGFSDIDYYYIIDKSMIVGKLVHF